MTDANPTAAAAAVNLSAVAKQLSETTIEIEALNAQIEPVVERIKELKQRQKELRAALQGGMNEQNVEKINTPAVQISFKSGTTRVRPFNRETVQLALGEFFRVNNVHADAKSVIEYIDTYRKENKMEIGGVVRLKKNADLELPNVSAVQPLKVVARPQSSAGRVDLYDT